MSTPRPAGYHLREIAMQTPTDTNGHSQLAVRWRQWLVTHKTHQSVELCHHLKFTTASLLAFVHAFNQFDCAQRTLRIRSPLTEEQERLLFQNLTRAKRITLVSKNAKEHKGLRRTHRGVSVQFLNWGRSDFFADTSYYNELSEYAARRDVSILTGAITEFALDLFDLKEDIIGDDAPRPTDRCRTCQVTRKLIDTENRIEKLETEVRKLEEQRKRLLKQS